MNEKYKSVTISAPDSAESRNNSVLRYSNLFIYVNADSAAATGSKNAAFDMAVKAFKSEASETLAIVRDRDDDKYFEPTRKFIIKVLLFIGFLPDRPIFGRVARIIELLAKHREYDIKYVIADMAERTGVTYTTLSHSIDRCFDFKYDRIIENVKRLTGTNPLNAKDVICNLALYVCNRMTKVGAV